jgi:hypothetical protein
MTRRTTIRTSAAAVGSAALLALAGCGSGSTTSAQSPSAGGAQQQARAGGPFTQASQSALAKELGVSTTRLQHALATARPAGAPGGAPPSGRQGPPPAGAGGRVGQLAANLAKQLNLPTAKVQQALAKVLPRRPPGTAQQAPSSSSS